MKNKSDFNEQIYDVIQETINAMQDSNTNIETLIIDEDNVPAFLNEDNVPAFLNADDLKLMQKSQIKYNRSKPENFAKYNSGKGLGLNSYKKFDNLKLNILVGFFANGKGQNTRISVNLKNIKDKIKLSTKRTIYQKDIKRICDAAIKEHFDKVKFLFPEVEIFYIHPMLYDGNTKEVKPINILDLKLNNFSYDYGIGEEIIKVNEKCLDTVIRTESYNKSQFNDIPTMMTINEVINICKSNNIDQSIIFTDRVLNEVAEYISENDAKLKKPRLKIHVVDNKHIEFTKGKTQKINYNYVESLNIDFFLKDKKIPNIIMMNNFYDIIKCSHRNEIYIKDIFKDVRNYFKDLPQTESIISYIFKEVTKNNKFDNRYNDDLERIFEYYTSKPVITQYHDMPKDLEYVSIDRRSFYKSIFEMGITIPVFDIHDGVVHLPDGVELNFINDGADVINTPGYYKTESGWHSQNYFKFHPNKINSITSYVKSNQSINSKLILEEFNKYLNLIPTNEETNKIKKVLFVRLFGMFNVRKNSDTRKQNVKIYDDKNKPDNCFYLSNSTGEELFYTFDKKESHQIYRFKNIYNAIIEYGSLLIKKDLELNFKNIKVYKVLTDGIIISLFEKSMQKLDQFDDKIYKIDQVNKCNVTTIKEFNTLFEKGFEKPDNSQSKFHPEDQTVIIDEDGNQLFTEFIKCQLNKFQFTDIVELLNSNAGFVLQGKPGTGKSYTINNIIIPTLKNLNKNYIVTSFTHSAISNNDQDHKKFDECATIHSLLNLFKDKSNKFIAKDGKAYNYQTKKLYDYIIVDEFSQANNLLLFELKHKFYNCKFILSGDQDQLGHISDSGVIWRYNRMFKKEKQILYTKIQNLSYSKFFLNLCDNNHVELTTIYRNYDDVKFINIDLKQYKRTVEKKPFDAILCYSNEEVDNFKSMFPSANVMTIFKSQGREFIKMCVLNYDNLPEDNKYVARTRINGNQIYQITF